MIKSFKIVVEKHSDGYVAHPIGLKGVVLGEGNTYEEALHDVKSAIGFHMETFGPEVLDDASSALEVFFTRGYPANFADSSERKEPGRE